MTVDENGIHVHFSSHVESFVQCNILHGHKELKTFLAIRFPLKFRINVRPIIGGHIWGITSILKKTLENPSSQTSINSPVS